MPRYYPKDFRGSRYRDSATMREILQRPEVAQVFSTPQKKQRFFQVVKDATKHSGSSRAVMRKALAVCRYEERIVSRKESLTVAKSFGIRSISRFDGMSASSKSVPATSRLRDFTQSLESAKASTEKLHLHKRTEGEVVHVAKPRVEKNVKGWFRECS